MNQRAQAVQLNRTMLWLVPLVAVSFFVLNRPGTSPMNIKEVSVSEAKALIDSGATVVDVRGPEAYGGRHVPGALSIPLAQLQTGVPASLSDAKDKSIVVYCNDGVVTGPEGTQLLNSAGYSLAVNLKSGIEGWQSAGLPVQHR
jgi:rhodanese-related sulfurtransferase